MTVDDVIQSLSRMTGNPLFAPILSLSSPAPHTMDIRLAERDDWLPWLLASVPAMILPAEWRTLPDFPRLPVGTGPYCVVRNHPIQLTIRAFDDYFGYRALIDEVNIWVLPELSHELSYSVVQLQNVGVPPAEDGSDGAAAEIRQEDGATFSSTTSAHRSCSNQRYVAGSVTISIRWRCCPIPRPQASISGRRPTGSYRAGIIAVINRRRPNRRN